MAASYPAALKTFTSKTNKVDLVDAAHINDVQAEVTAIETTLGINVEGSQATLLARLAIAMGLFGELPNGSSFPVSPIANQAFYRTDLDILYIRNAANSAWNSQVVNQIYSGTTSSTRLLISSDAGHGFTADPSTRPSYEKCKEFTMPGNASGTVRITFDWTKSGDDNASAGVLLNSSTGGGIGSLGAGSSGTVNSTITFVGGDKIQVWAGMATGTGSDSVTISNCRLYYDFNEANVISPTVTQA